jgi:NAD(P)-dependent dehydrogenase (short-subunit alcohol dehydrogenase family)
MAFGQHTTGEEVVKTLAERTQGKTCMSEYLDFLHHDRFYTHTPKYTGF